MPEADYIALRKPRPKGLARHQGFYNKEDLLDELLPTPLPTGLAGTGRDHLCPHRWDAIISESGFEIERSSTF